MAPDEPAVDGRARIAPGKPPDVTGNAEASWLRWRTRDTSRQLLFAFVAAFGGAFATGMLLWADVVHAHLTQVLIVAHLAAGVLALAFFVPFVVVHWRDGREPLSSLVLPLLLLARWRRDRLARRRFVGHVLMWSLALVFVSGCIVAFPAVLYLAGYPLTLPYGSHVWLLGFHAWATLAAALALAAHFPTRERS